MLGGFAASVHVAMMVFVNYNLHPPRPSLLQVVSDVAVASSQSLPPYLAALYARVVVLQLQGVLLPAACTGSYAFQSEVR